MTFEISGNPEGGRRTTLWIDFETGREVDRDQATGMICNEYAQDGTWLIESVVQLGADPENVLG